MKNEHTEIIYPNVIFRLKNEMFSVSGKYVSSIQPLPSQLIQVPHAPAYVKGTFSYQGSTVSIVNLRQLFDWQTVENEFEDFTNMIENRKNDHLNWVRTLEQCLEENKPFTLATDCHQCALGKWRDSFHTEHSAVMYHLNKLDAPHKELHDSAVKILKQSAQQGQDLKKVKDKIVPEVLSLLDEMKEVFKNSIYREMVVVLNGEQPVALMVDEIIEVDYLQYEKESGISENARKKGMIKAIQRYDKTQELVLELDVPLLQATVDLGENKSNIIR